MTSEDDNISVTGSPAVIRRRLGVVDVPNKEDNLSPGIIMSLFFPYFIHNFKCILLFKMLRQTVVYVVEEVECL